MRYMHHIFLIYRSTNSTHHLLLILVATYPIETYGKTMPQKTTMVVPIPK